MAWLIAYTRYTTDVDNYPEQIHITQEELEIQDESSFEEALEYTLRYILDSYESKTERIGDVKLWKSPTNIDCTPIYEQAELLKANQKKAERYQQYLRLKAEFETGNEG